MLTSNADVFRTRQVVRDLIDVVRLHRDAIACLGATGAEQQFLTSVIDGDCKLSEPDPTRTYSILLLAAALPEENFNAFVGATALLLASRLQAGAGEDDLYWNWGAFREHYGLSSAPVRAALMNGFRYLDIAGIVTLNDTPTEQDCLTVGRKDVLDLLEADTQFDLLAHVVGNASAEECGQLWDETPKNNLSWQSVVGFRYLYERPVSLTPKDPEHCMLLPWI